MSLRIYHASGTCALASVIALEETGADYEIDRIDFQSDAQKQPDYLAINPRARVPALVTQDGVLTETPAILAWIAQAYPKARLAPTDPWGFAKAQEFNNYLCSTVHTAHAHRRRGARWADDPAALTAMTAKVQSNMHACYRMIESALFKGPWVLGDAYSVCDAYLFTIDGWLEGDGVSFADFPTLAAHRDRVLARPATARVLAKLS